MFAAIAVAVVFVFGFLTGGKLATEKKLVVNAPAVSSAPAKPQHGAVPVPCIGATQPDCDR